MRGCSSIGRALRWQLNPYCLYCPIMFFWVGVKNGVEVKIVKRAKKKKLLLKIKKVQKRL